MELLVHPAANIFPMISDGELKEMATSIQAYGLQEKIAVIREGDDVIIIDGRNRRAALNLLNVKDDTIVENYTTEVSLSAFSVEEYVLMKNIERRNLTGPQRKKLAGQLAVMLAEKQKDVPKAEQEDTLEKAAALAGVSRRTAATAKQEVLEMAASESEVEGKAPKQKKKSPKKGPKMPPARMEVVLSDMTTDLNGFGHNFKIDELKTVIAKAKVVVDVAESKFEVVAKKAAEEAAKLAEEANAALESAKAERS